jgi:hypothetical protein
MRIKSPFQYSPAPSSGETDEAPSATRSSPSPIPPSPTLDQLLDYATEHLNEDGLAMWERLVRAIQQHHADDDASESHLLKVHIIQSFNDLIHHKAYEPYWAYESDSNFLVDESGNDERALPEVHNESHTSRIEASATDDEPAPGPAPSLPPPTPVTQEGERYLAPHLRPSFVAHGLSREPELEHEMSAPRFALTSPSEPVSHSGPSALRFNLLHLSTGQQSDSLPTNDAAGRFRTPTGTEHRGGRGKGRGMPMDRHAPTAADRAAALTQAAATSAAGDRNATSSAATHVGFVDAAHARLAADQAEAAARMHAAEEAAHTAAQASRNYVPLTESALLEHSLHAALTTVPKTLENIQASLAATQSAHRTPKVLEQNLTASEVDTWATELPRFDTREWVREFIDYIQPRHAALGEIMLISQYDNLDYKANPLHRDADRYLGRAILMCLKRASTRVKLFKAYLDDMSATPIQRQSGLYLANAILAFSLPKTISEIEEDETRFVSKQYLFTGMSADAAKVNITLLLRDYAHFPARHTRASSTYHAILKKTPTCSMQAKQRFTRLNDLVRRGDLAARAPDMPLTEFIAEVAQLVSEDVENRFNRQRQQPSPPQHSALITTTVSALEDDGSHPTEQCVYEQCLTEWNCMQCDVDERIELELCAASQVARVCWDCGKSGMHPPRRGACTPCKKCGLSFCPGNPIRGGICAAHSAAPIPAVVENAIGKPITPSMRQRLCDARDKWLATGRKHADACLAQSLSDPPAHEQLRAELTDELTADFIIGGSLMHGPLDCSAKSHMLTCR